MQSHRYVWIKRKRLCRRNKMTAMRHFDMKRPRGRCDESFSHSHYMIALCHLSLYSRHTITYTNRNTHIKTYVHSVRNVLLIPFELPKMNSYMCFLELLNLSACFCWLENLHVYFWSTYLCYYVTCFKVIFDVKKHFSSQKKSFLFAQNFCYSCQKNSGEENRMTNKC